MPEQTPEQQSNTESFSKKETVLALGVAAVLPPVIITYAVVKSSSNAIGKFSQDVFNAYSSTIDYSHTFGDRRSTDVSVRDKTVNELAMAARTLFGSVKAERIRRGK